MANRKYVIPIFVVLFLMCVIYIYPNPYMHHNVSEMKVHISDKIYNVFENSSGQANKINELDNVYESHDEDAEQMKRMIKRAQNCTLLIYNRAPKCASTTMLMFFVQLGVTNRFTFDPIYHAGYDVLTYKEQVKLVNRVNSLKKPALFARHLHFVNFKQFNSKPPLYINLIREPYERAVSAFYFYYSSGKAGIPQVKGKTVEECVRRNISFCHDHRTKLFWKIVPFFCGHNPICSKPSRRAVELAMKNVERHFAVVGYLEQFSAFRKILEIILPQYFTGFDRLYNKGTKVQRNIGKVHKTEPEDVKQLWTHLLRYEYAFYRFVKTRFDKLNKLLLKY